MSCGRFLPSHLICNYLTVPLALLREQYVWMEAGRTLRLCVVSYRWVIIRTDSTVRIDHAYQSQNESQTYLRMYEENEQVEPLELNTVYLYIDN